MDQRRREPLMARALKNLRGTCAAVAAVASLLAGYSACAEPYLAVEAGLKCNACHVNPSGGGKRNLFGMTYARTAIAERMLFADENTRGWNSEVNRWLGVGGDYRGGYRSSDIPGTGQDSEWATSKSTVYLDVRAKPGLLSIYADYQVAPGGSLNREAYALVKPANGKYTIKAGQFFLPFGLRLQDDSAFVRQRSGINFDTPDRGIELGLELPKWTAQIASSDGTAGAGSVSGKHQTSLSAAYVLPRWRLGASYNFNNDPLGDRTMLAVFAGWRTGAIAWLSELDFIEDDSPSGGQRNTYASLIEGNWRFRRAHNLKLTYEFLDPGDPAGEDEQERYSLVWEYSPIQLLQARVGLRAYNGVPNLPRTNRDDVFAEIHVYF
jgi:hypothetical protein